MLGRPQWEPRMSYMCAECDPLTLGSNRCCVIGQISTVGIRLLSVEDVDVQQGEGPPGLSDCSSNTWSASD
jgi:hypothetical protein